MHADDTMPGDLSAIKQRLDAGDRRMGQIEQQLKENTRVTVESSDVIKDIRDALVFARVGTKLLKWLGAIGAAAVTLFTLWTHLGPKK